MFESTTFFFPETALVYWYVSGESETCWIRSSEWKFLNRLWTRNRVDTKSGFFFILWRNKIEPSSLPAGRRGRQSARVWQTWQGYFLRVLSWSSLNINVFWSFTERSVQRKVKFGEKLLQTKLLPRLSHKVCRLLPSPVLLCKFTWFKTVTLPPPLSSKNLWMQRSTQRVKWKPTAGSFLPNL